MKTLVDRFNEEHDSIQIERQRQPFDEYYDKLFTSMTGGDAPDLAVFHAPQIQRFTDALTPLGGMLSDGAADAYVDSIWQETEFDGDQVALPLDTHPNGLYYNKDIFEEAGLDPESPPTNFEELQSAADTITAETDKQAFSPDPYLRFFVRQFIAWQHGSGGEFLNEDNTEAAFGDDNGVALAQFYHDIANEWNWDRADTTDDRGTKAFRSGDLAMTINGTWYYGVLAEQDFDWGMAKPFVAPDQSAPQTWANSHTLGVPNSGSNQEAAVEAAEWITQNSLEWGTEAGHLPAAQSVLDSDDLRSSNVWEKTLSTFSDMAQNDELSYMPSTENNENYTRPVNNAISQIYSGQLDPEEGIQQAASDVTDNLQG
ncbi:extracellular solute-binding protein family 1 [Halorubrum lipolyticum DSM 21995]|uniref:Extracellular solute-binding protein family 1 n=2 Tax=Halorubrum lipolyticum TaxID=368624 RepID=M0NNT5_9EURY|nr:extracellular solute-binding protein family 1 [Halorubrum lipolyticum DSM 21995]